MTAGRPANRVPVASSARSTTRTNGAASARRGRASPAAAAALAVRKSRREVVTKASSKGEGDSRRAWSRRARMARARAEGRSGRSTLAHAKHTKELPPLPRPLEQERRLEYPEWNTRRAGQTYHLHVYLRERIGQIDHTDAHHRGETVQPAAARPGRAQHRKVQLRGARAEGVFELALPRGGAWTVECIARVESHLTA